MRTLQRMGSCHEPSLVGSDQQAHTVLVQLARVMSSTRWPPPTICSKGLNMLEYFFSCKAHWTLSSAFLLGWLPVN